MLKVEERVGGKGWGVGANHVDVGGSDVVGVADAHGAGYHCTPITALGY